MVQKPIKCCSEKPSYLVTYSVCGSKKDYSVCLYCIEKECFSKYIVSKQTLENKIKNFQKKQNEFSDELSENHEPNTEHLIQYEQYNEHGKVIQR